MEQGLYRYDAIARLQDAQLRKQQLEAGQITADEVRHSISDYIQLGPLGSAFIPAPYPRVLLIDEIDKSDINLPNDLLNLFEEGRFEISELMRQQEQQKSQKPTMLRTADNLRAGVSDGVVGCDAFPIIVMTSNGERDFPPAFLRRCLRIEMPKPERDDLYEIVAAHLTVDVASQAEDLITQFLNRTDKDAVLLATDQLLNAVYLRKYGAEVLPEDDLGQLILAALTNTGAT